MDSNQIDQICCDVCSNILSIEKNMFVCRRCNFERQMGDVTLVTIGSSMLGGDVSVSNTHTTRLHFNMYQLIKVKACDVCKCEYARKTNVSPFIYGCINCENFCKMSYFTTI